MKLDLSKGPEPPAWAEQIFEQMRKERAEGVVRRDFSVSS